MLTQTLSAVKHQVNKVAAAEVVARQATSHEINRSRRGFEEHREVLSALLFIEFHI